MTVNRSQGVWLIIGLREPNPETADIKRGKKFWVTLEGVVDIDANPYEPWRLGYWRIEGLKCTYEVAYRANQFGTIRFDVHTGSPVESMSK